MLGLVSKALGDPVAVATVEGWRRSAPRLRMGTSDDAIKHNWDTVSHAREPACDPRYSHVLGSHAGCMADIAKIWVGFVRDDLH